MRGSEGQRVSGSEGQRVRGVEGQRVGRLGLDSEEDGHTFARPHPRPHPSSLTPHPRRHPRPRPRPHIPSLTAHLRHFNNDASSPNRHGGEETETGHRSNLREGG